MQIHPSTLLFGPGCPLHLQHHFSLTSAMCSVAQSCPTLLQPHGLQPARLLCPWYSPGWSGSLFCIAGDSPNPGIEPASLASIALAGAFFTTVPPRKPLKFIVVVVLVIPKKAMAPNSSTLAWKIPWMEEPGGLQSMGSLKIGHDSVTSFSLLLFTFMHWRRKWQPSPVFLPGESQGWQSLVGCRQWGRTESDTTEAT